MKFEFPAIEFSLSGAGQADDFRRSCLLDRYSGVDDDLSAAFTVSLRIQFKKSLQQPALIHHGSKKLIFGILFAMRTSTSTRLGSTRPGGKLRHVLSSHPANGL
ncbi:MAG: hypothetical protein WAO07_03555 [Desulfobacterales bacterium]